LIVPKYLKRPLQNNDESGDVRAVVARIIEDIQATGLQALRRYSSDLDQWSPKNFRVSKAEIDRSYNEVSKELITSIRFALDQVRNFAVRQRETLIDFEVTTLPGVRLGQRQIPMDSVGSYSPGGRYPLIASSIMTVATPRVAGVREVIACAPPHGPHGLFAPQLVAMHESGADAIFCMGGVQALAALAFGIPEEGLDGVDMIVGAGNQYVAEAKRQLFGIVGIDFPAGPTEILVIADDSASPVVVAADLLGQAEHGPNSPVTLLTTSEALGAAVRHEVEEWLQRWPTAEVAGAAWRDYGAIVVCGCDEELVEVADSYAPEHLEVQTRDPEWFFERLTNYGTLFLGPQSTVVYSDKAIGLNHVLPTGQAARYTGGLWVGKFIKTVTYQRVDEEGTRSIAETAARIADAEGMLGHALTARLRLDALSPLRGA
jgi:sulfopropanediol 3-dehydrogenase